MPRVYEFSEFPSRIGFIVGKDESNRALAEYFQNTVTKHNLDAYLSSRKI